MSETTWDGIERRKKEVPPQGPSAGTPDAAFLRYIVAQLEAINKKMDEIHKEHHEIKADVRDIRDAFPKDEEGKHDFDGHHDDHIVRRDAAKSWNEIFMDVKKKMFSGVAWATVIFLGYAIFEATKQALKK